MSGAQFDNLLAVDTSTRHLRLAVSFGGDRLVTLEEHVDRSHGQLLFRKLSDLLLSAGLEIRQLQGVVVCTGPGSFTGLRIGLAAVKGIATVHNLPVTSVSLFELAAYLLRSERSAVHVVVPFTRGLYCLGYVQNGTFARESTQMVTSEQLVSMATEPRMMGIGFESHEKGGDRIERLSYSASDLLHLGRGQLVSGNCADLSKLEPLYLQKSQAEIRFDERRQRS